MDINTTLIIEMKFEGLHLSVLSEDGVKLLDRRVEINNNQTEHVLLEINSIISDVQKDRQDKFKLVRLVVLFGGSSKTAERIITAIFLGISLAYGVEFIKTENTRV